MRPSVWSEYQSDLKRLEDQIMTQSGLRRSWEMACEGNTEIDCFDFWAKELKETGYLHNHSRMWFASIWIFTLNLPWQLGADFFLRHLLDGGSSFKHSQLEMGCWPSNSRENVFGPSRQYL